MERVLRKGVTEPRERRRTLPDGGNATTRIVDVHSTSDGDSRVSIHPPTVQAYGEFLWVYDFLNDALFGGELP